MPRPVALRSPGGDPSFPALRHAEEPASILTALPFYQDPDQEWGRSRLQFGDLSGDLAWDVDKAMRDSLEGMNVSSSWSGSRASATRDLGGALDHALMRAGLVRRISARICAGPIAGGRRTEEAVTEILAPSPPSLRVREALAHARSRARHQIGRGLLDAAVAMFHAGILEEAELICGDGRNRAERLLVRDAVFAAEDLTIEEMMRVLVKAPYQLAEERGEDVQAADWDSEVTEETPLIFVQCLGLRRRFEAGRLDAVLEGVDFQSIETLRLCLEAVTLRDVDQMRRFREVVWKGMADRGSIWRRWRR